MNVQQELNDIISTCQSIEDLWYIKVRGIRMNPELYSQIEAGCEYDIDDLEYTDGGSLFVRIWDDVKIKVFKHKMVTPWMLIVTPVNNKSDRIYR